MKKRRETAESGFLLVRHRDSISRCVKCGSCRTICPAYLVKREESVSPRGRVAMTAAVLRGSLDASVVFIDRLTSCTSCLACESACASGVPVAEIIQAAREEAVRQSGSSLVRKLVGAALKNSTFMSSVSWAGMLALHYRLGALFDMKGVDARPGMGAPPKGEDRTKRGTILFFPGCSINHYLPRIGEAAMLVLNRIGYEVVVPDGLQCCGRPLLSLGDRQGAAQLASRNAAVIGAVAADAVVTACASCSLTFKKEYPKLLAPGAAVPSVLDVHEFLQGRIPPDLLVKRITRKITWHDPCHLGRGQGLSTAARDLVGSVPGARLVEMQNRDRCCGFGGVMRLTHAVLSDEIAAGKAQAIVNTHADVVATGCPSCIMQIKDALHRTQSRIRVLHTVQVLAAAIEPDGGFETRNEKEY